MLVNNKAMSPTLELFKVFESGVVTFIDSDGDRRYDVGHMTLLKWGIIEGISGYSESLVVNFGDKGGADIFLDSSSC
ncbi:MAG: hypothetical protein IJE43_13465, partial [Alphaproteobacteria bacterium]|nr:hypothetical protein [Alphaproteobacteria bacterium]